MKILLIYPHFIEPRIHVEEIAAVPGISPKLAEKIKGALK